MNNSINLKYTFARQWRQAVQQPIGIKKKSYKLLRHILLSLISSLTSQENGNFLRCIYCHYVFDDQVELFKTTLIKLIKIGSFIDTETCIGMLEGKIPIEGRYFHLSFDDGFRNIYKNALPILRELHIPAIVYVPTAFIGANYEIIKNYCLNIARYWGIIETMTWEDLKTMQLYDVEIGSHTRTHVQLSDLHDPERLRDEILGSKLDLEHHLGTECKYISWPFGKKQAIHQTALKIIQDVGYRACFGSFRGTIIPRETEIYSIPRNHFEIQWPLSHTIFFASGKLIRYIYQ